MELPWSIPLWTGLVTATIYLCLALTARLVESKHDPQEPPLVKSRLPLIGHVLGLIRHGPKYFQTTSAKTPSPIYALKLFSGNFYVVTSPNLVSMVSKNTKTLSFHPFIAQVALRITHCSPDARRAIERNIDGSEGKDSYVMEIGNNSIAALGPGPEMQRLTLATLRSAWTDFLKPYETTDKGSRVSLLGLIRRTLTISSTTAIYGPNNPVRANKKNEQAFWDYDANLNMLLLDVCPAITAWKGHDARTRLTHAVKEYYDSGSAGNSSQFIEGRYRLAKKYGLSNVDAARVEVGNMVGILVNTVPTIFYLLVHIFSDDQLLADLRQELAATSVLKDENGRVFLDLAAIRNRCVLLQSTLQETLRFYSEGATVRMVCEDTVLGGRYLLKKNSILQIPNSVIHRDRQVWGDTSFQPRRFLKQDDKERAPNVASTTAAASYRPWGGGSTICPGRHFATSEIMGLTALFLWRFDMEPVDRKGWVPPKPKQDSVVEAVFPPSHDIDVIIKKRNDAKSLPADWSIVFN